MKNILKYMAVIFACTSLFASCVEKITEGNDIPSIMLPETIDFDIPADVLAYVYYEDESPFLPMVKGTSFTIGYTITPAPEELDFNDIKWTTTDESVATVVDGKITAVGVGSAVVSVSPVAPSIKIKSINIKVMETTVPVTDIYITDATEHFVDVDGVEYPSIYVSETMQLTVNLEPSTATFKTVKWTSSNPEIATVDPITGLITGVSPSLTETGVEIVTITATALDASDPVSESYEIFIDATIDPIGIKLTNAPTSRIAYNSRTFKFTFSTYPVVSTASLISWTTSDANVATVENGVVTIKTPGTVTITATCSDTESPIPGEFAGYEHSASATLNIPAGYIYEHFTDPNAIWWVPKTAGTGMTRKQNATTGEYYMEFLPVMSGGDTFRGDNGASFATWLHAGAFPIICVRIDDVADTYGYTRNFNIDTSGDLAGTKFSGNFGGSNNKWKTKYRCSDGSAILIYDLSTQTFPTGGALPTNVAAQFGTFQFKYADIRRNPRAPFEAGENGMFRLFWIETFETEAAMSAYLTSWSQSAGITYAP